jgi:hypothetical protein
LDNRLASLNIPWDDRAILIGHRYHVPIDAKGGMDNRYIVIRILAPSRELADEPAVFNIPDGNAVIGAYRSQDLSIDIEIQTGDST